MGESATPAGAMPVFLIRVGGHRVPNPDPLGVGTASLDPAFPFDDVQELATFVSVPMVTNVRLEPNNRGRGGEGRSPRRQQFAQTCFTRKVSRVHGLEVVQCLRSWGDLHSSTLRDPGHRTRGRLSACS